jgi:hypothetical protein
MVSKPTFEALALPHSNGNYFLRPDRILGMYLLNSDLPMHGTSQEELDKERSRDLATKATLASLQQNVDREEEFTKRTKTSLAARRAGLTGFNNRKYSDASGQRATKEAVDALDSHNLGSGTFEFIDSPSQARQSVLLPSPRKWSVISGERLRAVSGLTNSADHKKKVLTSDSADKRESNPLNGRLLTLMNVRNRTVSQTVGTGNGDSELELELSSSRPRVLSIQPEFSETTLFKGVVLGSMYTSNPLMRQGQRHSDQLTML